VGGIPTMFKLPSEVQSPPGMGGYFDPNVGLNHKPSNKGPSPQEIVDLANRRLAKYGISPITEEDLWLDPQYISAEVGDDEETASNSKAFIGFQQVNQELLGMKVSETDTSINYRFGNFAEDLIILPDGYGQTYLNTRNTSSSDAMSFIDIPKIRLAIDIRPMRMDHSATNDGKASMVGSRMSWIPLNGPFRGVYEAFNLFQDLNLGLHRDKKFPYLPSSLGGYGKELPFRNVKNLERFMKAYKQGSHSELIRNIVNRTIDYIGKLTDDRKPAKDPLLSHIVRFQSSFHDWIKGKSIYAPVTWLDVPPEVAKYRVGKLGESALKDEIFGRLLAEKEVISEQQLEIAVEHNELCKALLKTETIPEFKKIRDEARMRWNSFSIFSLENYGMIKELSLDTSFSKRPLRDIDVSYFTTLVKEMRYNLRHILGEEFIYWPEAMDEIYGNGPMKVHFSFSPLNKVGTRSFAAQRSEYTSEYIDIEEKSSMKELADWVRRGMEGKPPTTMLNDDEHIIKACEPHAFNIIITDDIKLCKRANNKLRKPILRMPVSMYYKTLYFGAGDFKDIMREAFTGFDLTQSVEHMDEGSIKSFEEARFRDGVMLKRTAIQRFNAFKKMGTKDPTIIEEDEDFENVCPERPTDLLFDSRNILKMNRNRKGRIPAAKRQN
jgi:hypothetical protein